MPNTTGRLLVVLATLLVPTGHAAGQDSGTVRQYGDSTLRQVILPRTREIYNRGGEWVFVLTRENPLNRPGALATEVSGVHADGHFGRVFASVWTDQGRYSAEYYLSGDTLLLTYETFEYFEDARPDPAWRNFKCLPA